MSNGRMPKRLNQPYDVIVVGGGPAGLSAAKSAAKGGARTLVLEEHREIGLPHHCSGWIWSCPYSEDLFEKPEFKKLILQKLDSQCIYGPSGKLAIEIPMKGWVIDRVEFDRVLARAAVREGADISLSSRVVGLLLEGDKVKGVSVKKGNDTINAGKRNQYVSHCIFLHVYSPISYATGILNSHFYFFAQEPISKNP